MWRGGALCIRGSSAAGGEGLVIEVLQLWGITDHVCQCPGNALFCHGHRWQRRQGLTLHGVVEGQVADDILLDTGCSKTLVWRELLPQGKILPEQVLIRCAHEDCDVPPGEHSGTVGWCEICGGGRCVGPLAHVRPPWHRCATTG